MRAYRVLIVLSLYFLVATVFAQGNSPSLQTITLALRVLASTVFGISIALSAYQIFFSGGSDKEIEAAKNRIKNAIIAYLIIIASTYVPDVFISGSGFEPVILIPVG